MKPPTDYYDAFAQEVFARYIHADTSRLHEFLRMHLPASGSVLEIGCGSGRDALYMAASLGLDVVATDASAGLLELARKHAVSLRVKRLTFEQATFPLSSAGKKSGPFASRRFDAVVSLAMLMHLQTDQLFDFAFQVREFLAPDGVFLLSFSPDHPPDSQDPTHFASKNDFQRQFHHHVPEQVILLFERMGMELVFRNQSADPSGRPLVWENLVFRNSFHGGSRPVDRIEAILNRDKKTSTYKFALLRALSDIAQTSWHLARWTPNGRVLVPMGLVLERWIQYYWPIFAAKPDLPEMRLGDRARGLKFREPLKEMIRLTPGGIAAFRTAWFTGTLSTEQAKCMNVLARSMLDAIVKGPVEYAGGPEHAPMLFQYVRTGKGSSDRLVFPVDLLEKTGFISMPADLWREFCLLGHWIGEAIVLRWAQLSMQFSGSTVRMSDIVEILLQEPDTNRLVSESRNLFRNLPRLECVWTGNNLSRGFEVDHVIPFSLWRNNELWNLVPSSKEANRTKSDKLVCLSLLEKRRDCIIDVWKKVHEIHPARFEAELRNTLLGPSLDPGNWELPAFATLMEAIELTACQRGIERWGEKYVNAL